MGQHEFIGKTLLVSPLVEPHQKLIAGVGVQLTRQKGIERNFQKGAERVMTFVVGFSSLSFST